jgi:hypothetical protein
VETSATMAACVLKDVDLILHANVQMVGQDDFAVSISMSVRVHRV